MTVSKASRMYNIPMQTLRDRVIGKIDADCVTTGRAPVMSLAEEAALVDHLKIVARYGYGYSRQDVVDIASDYAAQLGKRGNNSPFTLSWFRKLKGRWPELNVVKPRGLELQRAEATSEEMIGKYFRELEQVLDENNLKDKPHLIYNLDEKGISQDHTPPCIVVSKLSQHRPQAVTSGKSNTTTILGCGSASGTSIPPYFVFAGKRLFPELLEGTTPGAGATMSESGWSTTDVFRKYLTEHFVKFIPQRQTDQKLLLIVDGHKSHIALDIVQWAKDNNIIIFIFPAHTSHLLQPLDVGCYGPFQKLYYDNCHKFMRQTSAAITRYDMCLLACGVYHNALSADNLHSAFRKSGIYPFNASVVSREATMSSDIFIARTPHSGPGVCNEGPDIPAAEPEPAPEEAQTSVPDDVVSARLDALLMVKWDRVNKTRNTLSIIVSGKNITNSIVEQKIAEHVSSKPSVKKAAKGRNPDERCTGKTNKGQRSQILPLPTTINLNQPGPSHFHTNNITGISDSSDSDEEIPESDKCCECHLFTPVEVRNNSTLECVNWARCDRIDCSHWVHLRYCTQLRAVRRGVKLYCSHCRN